jgi:hypothetical protein
VNQKYFTNISHVHKVAGCSSLLQKLGQQIVKAAKQQGSKGQDRNEVGKGGCKAVVKQNPLLCNTSRVSAHCQMSCKNVAFHQVVEAVKVLLTRAVDVCEFIKAINPNTMHQFVWKPSVMQPLVEVCECSKRQYECKMATVTPYNSGLELAGT